MDDICISVASKSVKKNIIALKENLQALFSKADSLSIVFEKSKSELVHFSKKKIPYTDSLQLDNFSLKPSTSVKWLGIWLQHRLSFQIHVEKRMHLAQGAMQRLLQISSKTKGLGFNALRQLYLTCIIPALDYGSVLWYNRYGTEKLSKMCDKLQKHALHIMTGAYRSSPIKALEVEAALLPTRVRHFKQSSFYALRILKLQVNHPIYQALSSKLQDELDFPSETVDLGMFEFLDEKPSGQLLRIALLLRPLTKHVKLEIVNAKWSPPWREDNLSISISKSNKSKVKEEHLEFLESIPPSHFIVYTDGSLVKDKGCGIGITVYFPYTSELKSLSYNLGDRIGIADAESYAIFKALLFINQTQKNACCYIFSDSQAAILRISKSNNFSSFKVRSLSSKMDVKIHWCPGHQGIEGNELADNLARKSLDQPTMKKHQYTSYSFLVEGIRKNILQAWDSDWTKQVLREEEGRKAIGLGKFYRTSARISIPSFNTKAINLTKFSRQTQTSFFQARTGIGNTLAHLYLIGKVDSNICNFCNREKQTMEHLLLHCPQFSSERDKEFEGLEPRNLQIIFKPKVGREKLLRYLENSKCIQLIKIVGQEATTM